ncbi:hypothetical protein [Nonomuraea jiangxiensis]|uniref:Uncharacterized protein n=1 Tax=Nonomuraea jiangxiensis TaxID=633440 RepID=A0A1G8G7D8_9ACTN|nr:hypothetical protein [Nonomuraea jiangxiensis]SDH90263.1 hypothetical protein SAMN05421869_103556 [Nonomuraea jiangxiensis]
MRGQETGSDHERSEADGSAAPATPPPSFGQTSGRDIRSTSALHEEIADDGTSPAVIGFRGSHPGHEETAGAQPWEVRADDATAYDWLVDPTQTDPTGFDPGQTTPSPHQPVNPGHLHPQPHHPYPSPTHPHHTGHGPHPDHPGVNAPHSDHTGLNAPHPDPTGPNAPHPGDPALNAPHSDHMGPNTPHLGHPGLNAPHSDHKGLSAPQQSDDTRPGDLPRPGREATMPPWPGEKPSPWPAKPVVPGAPPWEPPPAFTAAAAGMRVWPAPVSDQHGMPPWPAATGELVAEPDEPDDQLPAFDSNATNPEGFTRPAHYFDPEAAKRDAAQQEATQHQAPQPAAFAQEPDESTAPQPIDPQITSPAAVRPTEPQHGPAHMQADTPPAPQEDTPNLEETRPGPIRMGNVPLAAPVPLQQEDTHPFAREDLTRPTSADPAQPPTPAHYFDPEAAERDAQLFSPHPTNPAARPPEPGDVPVWPPNQQAAEKIPDLPFPRETWGQRHTTSLELPPPQSAYPAGAFKQPPFQTPPPPPAPPAKSKRALFVTLGALALAGVATGGFFAYRAVSDPAPTTAAARPTASAPAPTDVPSSAPPADVPGASVLNSEQTDPQKLSLSEAFPKKKVSAAGTTFTRVKAGLESSCDKAAAGAFADALREQKCSRVLRATYVDSKRRYAVTTGIAVLPTKDAATAADAAKDLSHNVWFRPLPGADGSGGERVHIAGGYAAGLVWGRYIVFSYATHADGHTPEAKEKTLPEVSGAFRDEISLVLERRLTGG